MPPKPSLPLRDGRLGSSSSHLGSTSQQRNEPYYSNEDIKLLHEIVTTGEQVLPTLPERDRLPTNALFLAAEQVLPAHGYDPDHAPSNISRLIFKIGGLRSEGTLMDKFSSVLEGMGINLEIVEDQDQQPSAHGSSSVKSSASAAPDQTGTFSLSPRYDARRRRNSESAAPTSYVEDLRDFPTPHPKKARAASFGSQPGDERLYFRLFGDENRPPRHGTWNKTHERRKQEAVQRSARPLPLRPLLLREDETDDGFPYRRHQVEEYPYSESEYVEEYAASNAYGDEPDIDHSHPRIENGPDHFVGSSDTMAQSHDDVPSEPVLTAEDQECMEEDVRNHQYEWTLREEVLVLSKWADQAKKTSQRNQHQEATAIERDRLFALSECMEVWRETAEAVQKERLAAQGPLRDADEDARLWRRASRGYDLVILHKAILHWYASTQDEIERTAVARRHIMRKRYFEAWRSHQAVSEAKIHNFRLRTLLRIWKRAAIHHEVRESVAVQRYRHDLVKQTFEVWYDQYRAQLADEFWACRLKESCMDVWLVGAQQRVSLTEDSVLYGERFVLELALSRWRHALQQVQINAYHSTAGKLALDLRRVLDAWRTEASLYKRLREFSEDRDCQILSKALVQWTAQIRVAREKALLAEKLVIQEYIDHWRNETKLRRYRADQVKKSKLEAFNHWRAETKLAGFQRLTEARQKASIIADLRLAAAEAQAEAVRVIQATDSLAEQREKASVLGIWRRRTSACLKREGIAANRYFFSVASSCTGHWYRCAGEEATRLSELRAFAARGSYYVATSNVLQSWAEITRRVRRERLTATYHNYRRRSKVHMVTKCLAKWRDATHDSHALSYDADNIHGSHLRDELADCIQLWRNASRMMRIMREVATTADQEVWWGKWSQVAKDLRETELDTANYCSDQTLARCWRTWEYAMLQNKGRQHVAATLQENNDKKLCRQVLVQWNQKATPESAYPYPDLRSSVASRRSVRFGNVRGVEQPRFGGVVNLPLSEPLVEQLPQIEETLGDIYTATPRHDYGRASELPRNTLLAPPREFAQSIPQRPKSYPNPLVPPGAAAPQSTVPLSSFPVNASVPPPNTQQPPQDRASTLFPSALPPQPQPFPDLDEDDISFTPSEGNDFPGTFMSTPSRLPVAGTRSLSAVSGGRRQAHPHAAYRRSATGAAVTTTPSALLDTPYERALRREYGTASGGPGSAMGGGNVGMMGGAERRSNLGGLDGGTGRVVATPRVTFADIREESGEGSYDGAHEGD